MLDKLSIQRVYNKLIFNGRITTKELREIGLSEDDVNNLLTINRKSRHVYRFYNVDTVMNYYKNMIEPYGNDEFKMQALMRMHEMDPNNTSVVCRIIGLKAKKHDYADIFDYIDILDRDESSRADANLLLHLFSFVTPIPERYKDRVYNMRLEDVLVDDAFALRRNTLCEEIYSQRYAAAYEIIEGIWKGDESFFEKTLDSILYEVLTVKRKTARDIAASLELEDGVSRIKKILKEESQERKLFLSEKIILKICDAYFDIDDGKFTLNSNTGNLGVFNAIQANDYEGALALLKSYKIRSGKRDRNNAILEKLLDRVMDKIKKCYNDIFSDFTNKDGEKAITDVLKYLKIHGLSQYNDYMSNLIKLSVLNKDTYFVEPAIALNRIIKGNTAFDTVTYITEYYYAISTGDLEKARLYMNLAFAIEKLGGPSADREFFRKTFEEEESSQKRKEELIARLGLDEKKASEDEDEKFLLLGDVVNEVKESKGLRILEELDTIDRSRVIKILSQVPDINVSLVGDRVAVRYVSLPKNKKAFYKTLQDNISKADKFYADGFYDEAIEIYSDLCSKIERPKPHIYGRLGLCYKKRGSSQDDYIRAYDYFKMAEDQGWYMNDHIVDIQDKLSNYNGAKVKEKNKE